MPLRQIAVGKALHLKGEVCGGDVAEGGGAQIVL